jgi:hypothetical protein
MEVLLFSPLAGGAAVGVVGVIGGGRINTMGGQDADAAGCGTSTNKSKRGSDDPGMDIVVVFFDFFTTACCRHVAVVVSSAVTTVGDTQQIAWH